MSKLNYAMTSSAEIIAGHLDKYSIIIDKGKRVVNLDDGIEVLTSSFAYSTYRKRDKGRKFSKGRNTGFSLTELLKGDL